MKKQELNYHESVREIETILAKIENGETDIDDLVGEIKKAAALLQSCREKLFHTEQEVGKIIGKTPVVSLDAG
jgi:exodeoxyribonuclease VII small subunit